jgi:threonine dehydrogenase-like Zn-dependent dehydrogenase
MKAIAMVPGTTKTRLADWPEPMLQTQTQVKVRVLEVGICGTDREEVAGGRADAPKGGSELIIGHEMLGVVVEVGTRVRAVKVGDLVVLTVRRGCGHCDPCKKGCFDMCETGQYLERGIKGLHGYQAEFVVEEEAYCVLVPLALRKVAVLTEPTTVVEKAIDHAARLQVARLPVDPDPKRWLQGKRVLVAGLGPIGLLASMVLRLRGANVFGMDIVPPNSPRPQLLQAMGGTYVTCQEIDTKPGFDMIVEAAGIPKLDFELIEALGFSGVYVLTGVPGDDRPLNVDGGKMMRQLVLKNQIVFGSVNAGHEHFKQAVIDLTEAEKRWKNVMESFITSRTPFREYETALHKKISNEIKAVITWHA